MKFNDVALSDRTSYTSYNTCWIIYVSYEYDGEKYEHIRFSTEDSNSYEVGDVVHMYTQPENPTDVRKTKEEPFKNIFAFGIGGCFLVGSILNFVSINKNRAEKRRTRIYGITATRSKSVLLLICLFSGMTIASMFFNIISFAKNAEAVEAKVSYVTIEGSSRKNKKVMYIDYEYKGEKYDDVKISDDVPSTADKGEIVTIYVAPDNPSDVKTYRVSVSGFVRIGILTLVIGVPVYAFATFFNRKRENPYKTGNLIMATIDEIMIDYNVTINKDNRRNIRCSYIDRFTGQRYEFVSDKVWSRLEDIFAVGNQIPVYVMSGDYSKYYVELEPEFEQSNAAEIKR